MNEKQQNKNQNSYIYLNWLDLLDATIWQWHTKPVGTKHFIGKNKARLTLVSILRIKSVLFLPEVVSFKNFWKKKNLVCKLLSSLFKLKKYGFYFKRKVIPLTLCVHLLAKCHNKLVSHSFIYCGFSTMMLYMWEVDLFHAAWFNDYH